MRVKNQVPLSIRKTRDQDRSESGKTRYASAKIPLCFSRSGQGKKRERSSRAIEGRIEEVSDRFAGRSKKKGHRPESESMAMLPRSMRTPNRASRR